MKCAVLFFQAVYFLYTVQKSLKHRRVKHFGYEFNYENNTVDKDKPLPGGKYILIHSGYWHGKNDVIYKKSIVVEVHVICRSVFEVTG